MMGNKLAPVLSSPQKEKVTSIFLIFFSCAAHLFVTPGKPWADTIDCSYRKEHTAKDLVGLKGYLAAGTIVSVVEEKVSVWQGQMKGAGRENSCWGGGGQQWHLTPSGRHSGMEVAPGQVLGCPSPCSASSSLLAGTLVAC